MVKALYSVGQGFRLTGRLWAAVFWFWLATAFLSALLAALLPFQVQGNQAVAVPLPADPGQRMNLMIVSLGLFFLSVGILLYLLGGTVEGIRRTMNKEPVRPGELLRFSGGKFGRTLWWAAGFTGFCLGLALAVVVLLAFFCAAAGFQPGITKTLAGAAFWTTALMAGFPILYSFIPVVEQGKGIRAAFGESARFFRQHAAGTLALVLAVSTVGAVIWWMGVFGAVAVNGLRTALGIAPFTTAFLPNFFLGLLLWWPQAVLSVFIPASLYTYYRGSNK